MTPKASAPWARLLTESRNPRSERLDTLSTRRAVGLLLDEDRRALVAALGHALRAPTPLALPSRNGL